MFDALNYLVQLITSIGLKILYAIIIVVVGFIIASIIANLIRQKAQKLEESARSFLSSFVAIAVKILAVISALFILGVPAASFVTILGSIGLAVGLAMQGALSNFAGGILIVVFHPFRVGDYVTMGGQSGVVQNISIFYTTILNDDNVVVTLPNGTLTNAAIVNTSVEENRRMSFEYALPYATDINAVRNILIDAAKKNSLVLSDPAPEVTVSAHDAGTVTVKLTAWTKSAEYGKANAALTEEIKAAFDTNSIARA